MDESNANDSTTGLSSSLTALPEATIKIPDTWSYNFKTRTGEGSVSEEQAEAIENAVYRLFSYVPAGLDPDEIDVAYGKVKEASISSMSNGKIQETMKRLAIEDFKLIGCRIRGKATSVECIVKDCDFNEYRLWFRVVGKGDQYLLADVPSTSPISDSVLLPLDPDFLD